MKNNPTLPAVHSVPTDSDIRGYAYHLSVQSGYLPGRDLEHWFEATACLQANIPANESHVRLHRHIHGPELVGIRDRALD